MDAQELITIAEGSIEAFNDRDWNRFRALLAPNAVYDEVATGRRFTGPDDIIDACEGWLATMSDANGTISNTLVSGNTVVIEVTWSGTHDGPLESPLGSTPASGNTIETRGPQLITISEGGITEVRQYFDMLAMLGAMGALPESDARAAGA